MSHVQADTPDCQSRDDGVQLLVTPKEKNLGNFTVRRSLPALQQTMVGPFIFFDEMGPATLPAGAGVGVRPHPHIGIATITYLFEGEIMHRDSLGYVQAIQPGAVNLMTAGRGIAHSERSREEVLAQPQRLHGIQSWMALPDGREEIEPDFKHVPSDSLPTTREGTADIKVILGSAYGEVSPVPTEARILYLDVNMGEAGTLALPEEQELAVYVVAGEAQIGGCTVPSHTMAVLTPGAKQLAVGGAARLMVLGGDRVGKRHIWWNFVSSSKERIEQAKADWREGRFPPVPGDDEFIPLPE